MQDDFVMSQVITNRFVQPAFVQFGNDIKEE